MLILQRAAAAMTGLDEYTEIVVARHVEVALAAPLIRREWWGDVDVSSVAQSRRRLNPRPEHGHVPDYLAGLAVTCRPVLTICAVTTQQSCRRNSVSHAYDGIMPRNRRCVCWYHWEASIIYD
eukprot:3879653-Pyramimonas_sp.AAC.1